MTFHPDNNFPDCMMPDGGECCAGHAAVCEDWHKQRCRIDELEAALEKLYFAYGTAAETSVHRNNELMQEIWAILKKRDAPAKQQYLDILGRWRDED
jgi:hypothetical protein